MIEKTGCRKKPRFCEAYAGELSQIPVRVRAPLIQHCTAHINHPRADLADPRLAFAHIAISTSVESLRWRSDGRETEFHPAVVDGGRRGSPSVSRQQPFHVSKNGWWRLRQALNAPNDLIGADRADIDAESLGLFEEARVMVGGEKRRLQRFGAFVRHTGRRREWARHG